MIQLLTRTTAFATAVLVVGSTLCAVGSRPTNASPTLKMAKPPATRFRADATIRGAGRRTRDAAPANLCTADYSATPAPQYFVGITAGGTKNYADGLDSAVVGGFGNEACNDQSAIVAGADNVIAYPQSIDEPGAIDSFIGAGEANSIVGYSSFIGAGNGNAASYSNSFVGAGEGGQAANGGAFVGAGGTESGNLYCCGSPSTGNYAGGQDSFVGAGDLNGVSGNGSFIGAGGYIYTSTGGTADGNQVSGTDSFIGAGDQNVVSGNEGFVGSGHANTIGSSSSYAVVAGGNMNSGGASYAAVGGGFDNAASGADATIPGGNRNQASGELSFAAGYQAHALHSGTFVWSDFVADAAPVADTGANQFVVRASGGVYLYSTEKAPYAGVELKAGSGTWASLSDRNAKFDVVPLDDASILAKVASLPVSAWRYKTESQVRHVGPMAQDFYAAFGIGEDDRHITSIDEDGVALSAIKALDAKLASKSDEIVRLRTRLASLEAKVDALASHSPMPGK